MKNPYKNIRYFVMADKYAVMESENREARILSTHDTLEEAIKARK